MEYVERDRERVKVKGEKYTDDGNQPILGSTASQIHNTQPLQNETKAATSWVFARRFKI